MRKLFTLIITIIISATVLAQSQQKISYQAVIRNSSGTLITSGNVGMRISILKDSANGTIVYSETQTPATNVNGLVSIAIGGETGFDTIDWANDNYFIKTETDPTGGTNYTVTGTSQILSVPYALHAKTSGSTDGTSGHYIGELFGGGVIYYLDKTGQHGLIVSPDDLSNGCVWSNVSTVEIGASARSTWDGKNNTLAIIAQPSHTTSAALLCHDYREGGFSDWYLPAIDELNKMFDTRYEINKILGEKGLKLDYYYASTEYSGIQGIASYAAATINPSYKYGTHYVRAIREL